MENETKEIVEVQTIKEKVKYKLIDALFCTVYCFILYLGTFIFKQGMKGFADGLYAISEILKDGLIKQILIPYVIIFATFLIIKSILRDNIRSCVVLTVVTMIITFISYYKYSILKLPFIPSDILLAQNAEEIAGYGLTFPPISLILMILVLALILKGYSIGRRKYYKKTKMSFRSEFYRIPLFICSAIIMFIVCISPNRYRNLEIANELNSTYMWLGPNAAFFIRLGDFYTPAPDGYTEENIQKIKNNTETEETLQETVDQSPNIILIMNESYSNPNVITCAKFSKNPMEEIEKLEEEDSRCRVGNTLTPVYGGGTSLPEFEALTGLSSYFLEEQIFPYTSYIKDDMNSIVREYNRAGYTTYGIHTNTKKFYNRDNVYDYLGFQNKVFAENIKNPETRLGGVIQDNEIANQIIKIFDENQENKFVFAVTMQNHMPYDEEMYDKLEIDVSADSLSDEEKSDLKNYVQGVYDGNKMYIKIVEYLKNIDEPTILIMFGDHLPAISSIYEKSEYSNLNKHVTPYIIWANYDVDYDKYLSEYMSPSSLSLSALKMANVNLSWYLKQFDALYQEYPAFNNLITIDKNLLMKSASLVEEDSTIYDCRILQYDLLIKRKFIEIL